MIVFNWLGLALVGIGLAVAVAFSKLTGYTAEGPMMIVMGPVVLAADLMCRLMRRDGHWFAPRGGGHLFYLPVWLFGALWLVLGVVYTLQARSA